MSPASEPLVIRSLEFVGGMASVGGWRPPAELPEIAFAGRSNVGKSSLLNRLVHRKKLARVSNTPGRTREVNFFKVNGTFLLVDLPGYGYARVSKERHAEWRPLIESYLRSTNQLHGVVQLLDSRHDPSPDDLQMLDYLGELDRAQRLRQAVTDTIVQDNIRTRDLGGTASTQEFGNAVARRVA